VRAFWRRLTPFLGVATPFIGVALSIAALWVLRGQVQQIWGEGLISALTGIPASALLVAIALTALNYAVLTGYDVLAFIDIGRPLARWRICLASFVGYAIANSLGFAALSGATARYRFYLRWGVTPQQIVRVIVFYQGTFWLGLIALGGWSLLVHPPAGLSAYVAPIWATRLGGALLIVSAAYGLAAFFVRGRFAILGVDLSLPAPRLVAGQFLLSIVDWALAVAVLWVLLPAPRPPRWWAWWCRHPAVWACLKV
jgi:phosphatidylglycerol lysyltransferase